MSGLVFRCFSYYSVIQISCSITQLASTVIYINCTCLVSICLGFLPDGLLNFCFVDIMFDYSFIISLNVSNKSCVFVKILVVK